MLRDALRRIPPIAWRDARIADLRARVRSQQERIEGLLTERQSRPTPPTPRPAPGRTYRPAESSWHARIMEQQRVQRAVNAVGGSTLHPRRNLFDKLHNYELARSLGVATPQILGTWATVEEIEWDALPDRFVLKSNGGSTGRGVLPLERRGTGFSLVDGSGDYTRQDVVDHFAQAKGTRPPFFAEAMVDGAEVALPDDVKIYAFYGEIAYVMLRRMPRHADLRQARVRMFDTSGADLGTVKRSRAHDHTLPPPSQLGLMVETAAALSLAVPLPYIRVDLYGVGDDGLVLGELTPLPGDSHAFTPEWDRRLGRMYDEAEARLQVDLSNGRPYRVLTGPHDPTLTTSASPTTRAPAVPGWGPPTAPPTADSPPRVG